MVMVGILLVLGVGRVAPEVRVFRRRRGRGRPRLLVERAQAKLSPFVHLSRIYSTLKSSAQISSGHAKESCLPAACSVAISSRFRWVLLRSARVESRIVLSAKEELDEMKVRW